MPLHSVSAGRITHIDYEDNLCGQRPSFFLIRGVDNISLCAIISI